jgi:hypothetical protein
LGICGELLQALIKIVRRSSKPLLAERFYQVGRPLNVFAFESFIRQIGASEPGLGQGQKRICGGRVREESEAAENAPFTVVQGDLLPGFERPLEESEG